MGQSESIRSFSNLIFIDFIEIASTRFARRFGILRRHGSRLDERLILLSAHLAPDIKGAVGEGILREQSEPNRGCQCYIVFSVQIPWRFYNPIYAPSANFVEERNMGKAGYQYNRVSMTKATQTAALSPFPFSQ